MHDAVPKVLYFGDFTLNLMRCALLHKGVEIALRPKAFDVLLYLAERAGRLVAKEEIIEAVWPDVAVTDDSLVQCVREIRSALGDSSQRLIKTVHRRGYVFAAELSRTHDADHAMPPGPRGKLSIAVLPFENVTGDSSQQSFCDGITESIVTELLRFRDLSVRGHSASVGRDLGAEYIVSGTVRRLGGCVRIVVRLLEAASGYHLWAERFDRDEQDILAAQDQVLRSLVGTLVGRLETVGADRASRKPPASLMAYDFVLRGNALPIGDVLAEGESRRLYEKAIELDPAYGFPQAMLAFLLSLEWSRDMSGASVALDRALTLARKAVQLDDTSSDCAVVLAWIHLHRGAFDQAEQYYRRALALNPNSPYTLSGMGDLLTYVGRPREAFEWYKQSKLVDLHFRGGCLGVAHFRARDYDAAIAAVIGSPTMSLWRQAYAAACYAATNRIERARESAVEVLRLAPDFSANRFVAKEPYGHPADRENLLDGLRRAGLPG